MPRIRLPLAIIGSQRNLRRVHPPISGCARTPKREREFPSDHPEAPCPRAASRSPGATAYTDIADALLPAGLPRPTRPRTPHFTPIPVHGGAKAGYSPTCVRISKQIPAAQTSERSCLHRNPSPAR